MRYRELTKRGCQELRQEEGSHTIWYNPETGKIASVPNLGKRI